MDRTGRVHFKSALEALLLVSAQPLSLPQLSKIIEQPSVQIQQWLLEIEKIRGVDTGGVLASLSERQLIESSQLSQTAGQPYAYRLSDHFLSTLVLGNAADSTDCTKNVLDNRPIEEAKPTRHLLTLRGI